MAAIFSVAVAPHCDGNMRIERPGGIKMR